MGSACAKNANANVLPEHKDRESQLKSNAMVFSLSSYSVALSFSRKGCS